MTTTMDKSVLHTMGTVISDNDLTATGILRFPVWGFHVQTRKKAKERISSYSVNLKVGIVPLKQPHKSGERLGSGPEVECLLGWGLWEHKAGQRGLVAGWWEFEAGSLEHRVVLGPHRGWR